MVDLNTAWFLLVGLLFTGYAILDGFDLGVGALHLLHREDQDRRVSLNSIGPVWDGNEVWLVTGGGALFAAFPEVYATVFSGFYLPVMLLLAALIFRAVAIEFRSKQPMAWWRNAWDVGFSAGSVLVALVLGLALGNLVAGLPLDAGRNLVAGVGGLLAPYPLLVGVTSVALFTMHGSIYLALKTEGEMQARVRRMIPDATIAFVICYALTTMATLLYLPHMSERFRQQPAWFAVPVATLLAIANVPREVHFGRDFRAFLSSSAAIALLMALVGIGLYPNLVPCPSHAGCSLDVWNAASSQQTLQLMLIIAGMGAPLVLAYTTSVYWVFRGKVVLDRTSY
jgi:cytochrome d ubiquinol oxidase subunit II